MIARRTAALLAATVLAAALSACAPTASPTPSPTATGFASEEEAFAAAEATYRAYVDALNEVDLSDPATFEPVYALLSGEALDSEKRTLTQMHSDGWAVSGDTTLPAIFKGEGLGELVVCQNVSEVDVRDAEGTSQVAADRPDVFALEVRVAFDASSDTDARVAESQAVQDSRC
ncbi:hypothetical protein E2R54_08345 [Microbacterium oleivorans]|uniref:Lipoprotein n=1 Tax=Microbacterium oleivorans TaxID=273677 RepID=A0A4R5YEA6_9MICO|nr:hypothetical protein E2R54_08345 [Microbacterium oleivorans]